ncbi:MAG: HAD-IA family hydrolase, partial [Lachnospiraceae bacterium]
MLNKKEAVIFDLDGTLVDSMWMWEEIDREYLAKFRIEVPKDLKAGIDGKSFTETAVYVKERFHITDSIEQIKSDWNKMAWDKYAHEVPLKKGVKKFLEHCKAEGIKLGIATSNSVELVTNIVKVHGLSDYFSVIKADKDVAQGKPAPDIYLLVAKLLGVQPKKCLVFEDIPAGIIAGKSAGMTVCAVEDAYSAIQRDEKKRLADYYIQDYTEALPKTHGFLPISRAEMKEEGITQFDFVYVSGDAYVDHPSFGHAIITRILEAHGYKVGIIAQPDWKDAASIAIFGEPRLGFLVSAGNMDSMVNHYYVSKKHRLTDAYTPGGEPYKRPDHATVVYSNLIRQVY